MIIKKYKINKVGMSNRVSKYPWWELEKEGVVLEVTCRSAKSAQASAYKYAKIQKWKIQTLVLGPNILRVSRHEEEAYTLIEEVIEDVVEPAQAAQDAVDPLPEAV